ncbi:PepSY domain-containing protein [Gillisia sp. M10.2A]|uniref:NADPH--hemoprotein reductase n=1 Tax=Gillisia lutea TaxID=2909668 RepID=A0ABS9EBV2_9FLAO|nr:PepSY domain-containing protein [Gillisia lutea]MCF4100371.1 PepSY domain-containing protein [Gillisia lutea]
MIRSIWRYSHLILAVSSSIFLLLAAVTGTILAVEPVSNATKDYSIEGLNEISITQTISGLKSKYMEVLELEITPSNYVVASILTEDFESKTIYIDPNDLSELGTVEDRATFFNFMTNFHRSLFLKSTGRIFVGIVSFLLCLIAITGLILLIKRQGGWLKLFGKIKERNFEQRYHVILGRWFLMPIIIISATGVFLSAEKFELTPSYSIQHTWKENNYDEFEAAELSDFPGLKKIHLNEVRKIVFPFSEDPEDFYQIQLANREILIHQFTGEIVSEQKYPFVQLASMLSMQLHTGEGNPIWAIILFISSGSILFFMYSGFAMTLKSLVKKKPKLTTTADKDEAEYIILVGSETGKTFDFAYRFSKSLESHDKLVHLSSLNEYSTYNNAKHIIIFTATYGDGDAPASATKFLKKFKQVEPKNPVDCTVVGFGSMLYPNYCSYAEDIQKELKAHSSFKSIMELTKINEQSFEQFRGWANNWGAKNNIPVHLVLLDSDIISRKRTVKFKVLDISEVNIDNTFLLKLKPHKHTKFKSGDLIGFTPPNARRERLYSIAKIDGSILLSIKKHEFGKCSNYLGLLKKGQIIDGTIEKNTKFHFPSKAPTVIMISNGTGIAPFLGMIQNNKNTSIHLFWGGRSAQSFNIYNSYAKDALTKKKIESFENAFSREGEQIYVQDLLLKNREFLVNAIENGAVIMICGSINMQNGVIKVIDNILEETSNLTLGDLDLNKQLKIDCY